MVSVPKILQVITRLFESPQPSFRPADAYLVLNFLRGIPLDLRGPTVTMNMFKIVLHCPHASTLLENNTQLATKVILAFFVERLRDDAEVEEAMRRVIRSVSVNQNLSTPLYLTMTRKLSRQRRDSSTSDLPAALVQDDALVEDLLERVVRRIPRPGQDIREGVPYGFLSQKEMHKRGGREFEKPELIFLISTLRHVTVSRAARCKDGAVETAFNPMPLAAHIVEPVVRGVESLPAFRHEDAPPRADDWILISHLMGCLDSRLHEFGKRLWRQKARLYDPTSVKFSEDFNLPIWLAGFLFSLRGTDKIDAIKLWIDIMTTPQALSEMPHKMMRVLLVDVTFALRNDSDSNLRERLILGGNRILDALDAAYKSSSSSTVSASSESARTRMSFSRFFPPLENPKELEKTFLLLKDVLESDEEVACELIRESADFVRYMRRTERIDKQTLSTVLQLLTKRVLRVLDQPFLNEANTEAIIAAIVAFTALLRDIQPKESIGEEDVTLRNLFHAIAVKFFYHHSLKPTPLIIAVLLQYMELLDFTSNTQYTTRVRELILTALRSVPDKVQEINSHTAQHCFDMTLRAVRFHVVDEEVLMGASVALRHATDTAILREMSWEQRNLMIERGAALYRELSHSFSTLKQARRLGKQVLSVTALAASEKVKPREPQMHSDGTPRHKDFRCLRRCAQLMWVVAMRATLLPIPRTPVDRYLVSMLRFAKKHWIAETLTTSEQTEKAAKDPAVHQVDEKLSHEFLDVLLPLFHPLIVLGLTDKRAFYANFRRNKFIISTACEILQRNSDFLSPCVWYHVQRTLSNLFSILQGQITPLELKVLRLALKQTLRSVQACGNRGTWHLTEQKKSLRQETEDETILTPKWIGDMFSCAEFVDDPDLRLYLISLLTEQLEVVGNEATNETDTSVSEEEKSRLICLKKTMMTLRRGSVLYY
ncbi:hypothetical protein C3747_33g153 [Trypanosoma cruzi]|uniref:Uncharacterized protein n=2 Tax=Trypanosoma cruzi TaxID=5693 RepID=Q4DHL0_TRYCC|nr:hypothetical protein, conserved [Trypanosoma cruzi]EAN92017.1 hypothetical protein, conserved [Trypanosoma cruzi]PWV14829.1 hypothetical protein C3747_33g153 [Trypanosoma cruzi]|eukprot:XP_813868.1 hypothetical protein [Trypanosoma cruzi strain CL Brener]